MVRTLLQIYGSYVSNLLYLSLTWKIHIDIRHDNPMICSQVMVLGSRTLDFINTDLTDHKIKGLFIRDLANIDDDFDLYHDYTTNATSIQPCSLLDDGSEEDSNEQTSSPGIIMIVEAEDPDLSSSDNLKGMLTSALEKEMFTVVSATEIKNDDGKTLISIILREGYVIARIIPEHKYCGFDIHLWSNFTKHENSKKALLSAVGSKGSSPTSFRIIAGGMFGLPSWKQDEKIRGPQKEDICSTFGPVKTNNDSNKVKGIKEGNEESTIDVVMKESIRLLQGNDQKVAVLCGSICQASDKLESIESVKQVFTLNCPTMADFNEYDEGAPEALLACENHLLETLNDASENEKFDTMVIDSTAEKVTASILVKILTLKNKKLARKVFKPQVKVISTLSNADEKWYTNLLKLFKDKVFFEEESTFYSEVVLSSEEGSFMLLVTSRGEENFIKNLKTALTEVERKSGMTPVIENIIGGMWVLQEGDFVPSRIFLPDDYDQTSPLEQWGSQVPLGHQVIFQMEPSSKRNAKKLALSNKLVKKAFELALLKSTLPLFKEGDINSIEEYSEAGDGVVLVSIWSGGSIIVLWNGKDHVDINLFLFKQEYAEGISATFEKHFRDSIPLLVTKMRDEQPRGSGRVVSYWKDIKKGVKPHWA